MPQGRGLEFGSYAYKAALVRVGSSGVVVEGLWTKNRPLAAEGPAGEDPAWSNEARDMAGSGTVLGVGGRDLMIRFSRFPVVPPWRLQMMVGYELEQAAGRAKMDVVSDYMLVSPPTGPGEELTVMSVLARREAVEEGFRKSRSAGFGCRSALPLPLALFYAYQASSLYDPEKTALLIDIGYESTAIALCYAGNLFFARGLNDGTLRIVRAINEALGVGLERAEAFLRERIDLSSPPGEGTSAQLIQAHQAAGGALRQYAAALSSSLRFATQQLNLKQQLKVDKLIISGGGASVRGIKEAVDHAFNIEGTILSLGEHIRLGPKVNPGLAGPQAVAAAGLAIAAARKEPLVSLVPPAVEARRDFWKRRILHYLTPAAALLMSALAVFAAGSRLESARVQLNALETPLSRAEQLSGEYEEQNREYELDKARYQALRYYAGPAAVSSLFFRKFHDLMPEGLLIGSIKVTPADPGVLEMVVTGRSDRLDEEATLAGLRLLGESLNKLDPVKKASSTTLEQDVAAAQGVPFIITLQMTYAQPPPLTPEETP